MGGVFDSELQELASELDLGSCMSDYFHALDPDSWDASSGASGSRAPLISKDNRQPEPEHIISSSDEEGIEVVNNSGSSIGSGMKHEHMNTTFFEVAMSSEAEQTARVLETGIGLGHVNQVLTSKYALRHLDKASTTSNFKQQPTIESWAAGAMAGTSACPAYNFHVLRRSCAALLAQAPYISLTAGRIVSEFPATGNCGLSCAVVSQSVSQSALLS